MKTKTFICILTMFFFKNIHAQNAVQEYIKQSAIPVNTIDPDSLNYIDLEKIGDAIGNSRIVMLGEQDHGDAPAFLAKTRLIQYLHEKKGFNVLAFESDFFGLSEGWGNLPKEKPLTDSFLKHNITTIWTECDACQNLFYNYIPATYKKAKPLTIAGFDSEVFFSYSTKYIYEELDSVLRSVKAPITAKQNYASEILPSIKDWYNYAYSKDELNYNRNISYLTLIKEQLTESLGKNNFWVILAENLLQNNFKYRYEITNKELAGQMRDSLMAGNLRWLEEVKFKNEKIIVWAANVHINKKAGNSFINTRSKINSMGYYLSNDKNLDEDTYVIGFTSFEGTAGRLGQKQYKLEKPKKNSFENWIDPSYSYAFVDFKKYNQKNIDNNIPFYMSGFGHYNTEEVWNKAFDGIFFIRNMYPCSWTK